MGVVVEATNVQLDQKVALKLLASRGDDAVVADRFGREARAAARLRSDHVARVYDVGKDTLHGPFIVMELLEGRTLADVLSGGRVPVHRAAEYVIDACEGLAEAHARGIVHQDVKPANLFLVTDTDGRPTIKLIDFGIATVRSKGREVDAKSSHPSVGTPAYLAPEQLRGEPPADHRADIWALGCVLYELITGERPFPATRFTELVTKILEAPPEPIPAGIDVPAPIAAAIQRCLEKDRTKRFASTGELALTLLPFARRRAHSSVSRAIAHVKSSGLDPHLEMPSSMPPRPSDGTIDVPSSADLRPPLVPSFDSTPAVAPSSASVTNDAPAPNRSRRLVAGAAVMLLIALTGGAAWYLSGAEPTMGPIAPVPSAHPSSTADDVSASAASPHGSAVPGPAAAAPAVTSTEAAARNMTSPPPVLPAKKAPPSAAPRSRPSSAVAPAAPPAPAETEIRHVR